MPGNETLHVGLVGAVGRGGSFANSFTVNGARIHAVCDIQADRLDACAERLGASEAYADYDEMLDKSETRRRRHRHAHAAARAAVGPGAASGACTCCARCRRRVSIEECRTLVRACRRVQRRVHDGRELQLRPPMQVVRELARQGLFGRLYYAEGEYLHELKQMNEDTPWRRKWQTGIDGITYGTHSLGPILQWMPGDRVVRVCCKGAGHHYTDPRGELVPPGERPSCSARRRGAALIKIRVDMLSDRPHAMDATTAPGHRRARSSPAAAAPATARRSGCATLSEQVKWHDLEELAEIDESRRALRARLLARVTQQARRAGHGGGDCFDRARLRALHPRRDRLPHRHPRGHGHDAAGADLPAVHPARRRLDGRARLPQVDRRAVLRPAPHGLAKRASSTARPPRSCRRATSCASGGPTRWTPTSS